MSEFVTASQRFAILDHAPIGQMVLRDDFVVVFWNRCLESWTGIPRAQLLGKSILDRYPHLGDAKYSDRLASLLKGGPPIIFSSQLHRHIIPASLPGGKSRFQYTVVTAIPAFVPDTHYAMFAIQDVTSLTEAIENHRKAHDCLLAEMEERRKTEAELVKTTEELTRLNQILHESSVRDGLTGLYNHRYFFQVLNRDFNLARRNESNYACLLLDLDYFKLINDSFGHPFGDEVLKGVAEVLLERIRETDLVARYGGEEFAVLLPDTDLAGATLLAEDIRAQIAERVFQHGADLVGVTVSIGVGSLREHSPESAHDLLTLTDQALYKAKTTGRNSVFVATIAPAL
jgi:diguanylate cyclase (GGDEF)-like protein/PAS domain S-box-containing protein